MSPWTPPVNEFNGGEKATVFEKLQSPAKTVKLCFFTVQACALLQAETKFVYV